ncbi:glutaredoxin family protein [Paucisalibacillus globulus]|jgi:glutaredoxin|uniref:glutaredoxin family protein n=1 Tax=Paucisalibacillus globulus TaxID=351095 RepID=UPI000BB98674|nr:glutaredoxin family protein [Paucisalibacillus globulus]
MEKVIFYTKEICSLCDDAEALLEMFQQDYEFEIEKRDIYTNDEWLEEFQLLIPVVEVKGIQLDCEHVDFFTMEKTLKEHLPTRKK